MHLESNEVVSLLKEKMKKSQILLFTSVGIAMIVTILNTTLFSNLMSLYFVLLGALMLPNINRCKEDIYEFNKGNIEEVTGNILDIFPDSDMKKNGQWTIFLGTGEEKQFIEFSLPKQPDADIPVGSLVTIRYTKKNQLPIEILVS